MRKREFRGHNGYEWLYGIDLAAVEECDCLHYFMPNLEKDTDQDDIKNWDSVSYVGEYIGLNDKQGQHIYEGDIVRVLNNHEYLKFKVIYNKERCAFILQDLNNDDNIQYFHPSVTSEHIEVIGNIY